VISQALRSGDFPWPAGDISSNVTAARRKSSRYIVALLRLSNWLQWAYALDFGRTSGQRKAFRCACGWETHCVYGTWIGDATGRRIAQRAR